MSTTLDHGPRSTTPTARSAGSLLLPLAGGALVAGALLYSAGMATSPPQDSRTATDYIDALARDPGQTALSAMLLHYGNTAIGLGMLAAPALVRGVSGRVWTIVGALLTAIGLVSVTGAVQYDYWVGALGDLDRATALALYETVLGSPGVAAMGTLTLLGLIGPVVVLVGLARAGVVSWWLMAPALGSLTLAMALPFTPVLFGAISLVGCLPTIAIGVRMVQRHRAEARTA